MNEIDAETFLQLELQLSHREYLQLIQSMTPAQRLKIAFELSDREKRLLKESLRTQFPDMPEEDLHQLFLERWAMSHNRND